MNYDYDETIRASFEPLVGGVDVCLTCGAVVPTNCAFRHFRWHEELDERLSQLSGYDR
jgi:hypothetical protein